MNADGTLYSDHVFGYNLFAYCNNNPINYNDPTGETALTFDEWTLSMWWLTLIDGVLPVGDIIYWGVVAAFGVGIVNSICTNFENNSTNDKAEDSTKEESDAKEDNQEPKVPDIKYPGDDPTITPGEGYVWKGSGSPSSGQGNYVNPSTGEWLHPDLNHGPPIGPHWDYGVRGSSQTYRIFPDGTIMPK